jgi:hypothetical protein
MQNLPGVNRGPREAPKTKKPRLGKAGLLCRQSADEDRRFDDASEGLSSSALLFVPHVTIDGVRPHTHRAAANVLLMAAEGRGPLMHARIAMLRALNRNVERSFNPNRLVKHWGKRKLMRE